MFLTLISIILIHLKYKYSDLTYTGVEGYYATWTMETLPHYLIEISVHIFSCCPPGVDTEFTSDLARDSVTYSYNTITTAISIFRGYLIFPVLRHISFWTSARARRVARMTGVKANALFAIKSYLKDKPYPVLMLGLAISVLVLGISIRLFEADRGYVYNNFYLIIITMATIGYGDMYPVTYFGRAVCIISCVWGVFIISMFTVALMKASEFEHKEAIVYEDITRRKRLDKDARKIIQSYLLLTVYRKAAIKKERRSELLLTLISKLSRFKRQGHDFSVKGLDQSTEVIEDLNSWVEEIHENYQDLLKKMKKANGYSKKLSRIIQNVPMDPSKVTPLKVKTEMDTLQAKEIIKDRRERFQSIDRSKGSFKNRSTKTMFT